MAKLFLDDKRQPSDARYLASEWSDLYLNYSWVIVKSYSQFISWIKRNGLPTHISFDHDLVDDHYNIDFNDWELLSSEQLGVEETGLDCAIWLVEYCLDNGFDLPQYQVHSANPVGRRNIKNYLDNIKI